VAQTRRRRRRKHRGTKSGRIDTRPARGRPRSREEARARARSRGSGGRRRTVDRRDQPPTWQSAIMRALLAAGIFLAAVVLIFKQPIGSSVGLAAFMMVIYVPLGYYIDRLVYRRRQAAKQRAAAGK
jgi:hypothetical protein